MDSVTYKVLAVDDNPKTLKLLAILLPSGQFQLDYAFNGLEALKLASEESYDLVLLDIGMPGIDGFETCQKIRENQKNEEVPVIFLTGRSDIESLKKAFQCGGVDYLTKPFNPDELLVRVRTHLELKRYKDNQKRINAWLEEKIDERTRQIQETNAKLERANLELQSLDDAKTEFLRMINHEIRTPLNTILGFIHILKDEVKSSNLVEIVEYLEISSIRMEKFLMVVLQITELMTYKKLLPIEMVHLQDLIDSTIGKVTPELKAKAITHEIVGDLSKVTIQGNFKLMEICFESVLENAVQHSPDGSKIVVKVFEEHPFIVCDIIDAGQGFTDYALKNLFKFFTVGERHIDQNLGLDLALAKLIMDSHQGILEIRNNDGTGATVTLKIKTGLIDPAEKQVTTEKNDADQKTFMSDTSLGKPHKTIKERSNLLKNTHGSSLRCATTEPLSAPYSGSYNP